ncbi:MAG: transporter [Deltaproteobacteria bacterium]|nr:transporter [Deltaproteobacteria bacterium]
MVVKFLFVLLTSINFYHPLVTDDTATVGKEVFQCELTSEYSWDKEENIILNQFSFVGVLSFGLADNVDVSISIPYTYIKESGLHDKEIYGISDSEIFIKYRVFGFDVVRIGFKPALMIPVGDDGKGLGLGVVGFKFLLLLDLFLLSNFSLYINSGYIRHQNMVNEDLWHFSIGCDYEISDKFLLVANTGADGHYKTGFNNMPVFFLGGLIYPLDEDFDLSWGLKLGITEVENDYSLLLGVTFRF